MPSDLPKYTRSLRVLRLLACGLLPTLFLFDTALPAPAAEDGKYWVWLQDGSQLTGRKLENAYQARQPLKLDGRPLTDTGNPARVICDTTGTCSLTGPFVEMTNGDTVPGRADHVVGLQPEAGEVSSLVVVPRDSACVGAGSAGELRVRIAAVRRIVLHGQSPAVFQDGLVVLRDGRRLRARTVRFSARGVRALSDEGVVEAAFDDLAEVHFPDTDLVGGVLNDGLWQPSTATTRIVRIRTTGGAQLTFRRDHSTDELPAAEDRRDKFALLPAWSVSGVVVARSDVVWWTFCSPEEVPLSLLPATELASTQGVHRWSWQRNRNVFQTALRTGPFMADLGLGTHSPSELTFQLPPHTRQFSTVVGIDQAARGGGCATCRIYRDEQRGTPLWQREFLRGSDPPVRVGPIALDEATRLTLTTEFAHERRPGGADPFDLRDHVDWLMPLVTVDLAAIERPRLQLSDWLPPLADWPPTEETAPRLSLRPWWSRRQGRWLTALVPDAEKRISDAQPLQLSRRMQISLSNAFVQIAVGRDRADSTHHEISVLVDGEPQETTLNGELRSNAGPDDAHERFWILHPHVGREATVSLRLTPHGDAAATPAGILWQTLQFRPLIEDLPPGGKPTMPDVPLTSLEPAVREGLPAEDSVQQPGKLGNGQPLTIRGYPFGQGFGTRCNVALTYELDPSWRRFVTVVGLADGWQAVGPYEILLGDEPLLTTNSPSQFDRNTPGQQLDVEIPPGHKTITLRVKGGDSQAAWANAGFMK